MEENPKNPFWLRQVPADLQCGAKTRAGTPCKNWALKGKNRCKFHGGKSCGPTSAAGLERARTARLTHGNDSLEILKLRQADRVQAAADALAGDCLSFFDYIRRRVAAMDYNEFKAARPVFAQFCKGEISLYCLIEHLDGRKPSLKGPGLVDICMSSFPNLPPVLKEEIGRKQKGV